MLALGRLDIVKATGLSAPTAGKALETLEQLGRSRVYVYGQYLELLSRGTEPL